ncbi:MAG: peptidylprolyl isomerase [Saprospiraceae bacterium]|jgi:peptidyl-prolyl cis-trans isomerase SurA|nr:peptidylprolyl isomerase [Saprospiraceae bacterium]
MKSRILLAFFTCVSLMLFGQKDQRVLLTIKGQPVTVDEFLYIYTKNNGAKADFSRASLEENLNLYKNFKLKVQYARDLKLDTIPSTKTELAGYRKQLADSYLMDKEVTDKLIKEAYERSKKDLHLSHILKSVSETAAPADTLKAYNEIMEIRTKLLAGADFKKLAIEKSDDKTAKDNGGDLGFFTALFPNGFYNIENVAYNLKAGELSKPLRTSLGYHIFRLDEIRDARGEIEVSHILIRKPKEVQKKSIDSKMKIDSIYQLLVKGENFEDMAEQFSEDKGSSIKGGYIGFFGINRYERPFEDAAFSLKKDGDFCSPIETTAGWHIIKRISARPIGDFETARKRIEPKVKKDTRFDEAREALLVKIRKQCGLKEDDKAMNAFIQSLNDTYFANDWTAPGQNTDKILYQLDNGTKFAIGDFETYLKNNTRKRMSMKQTHTIETAVKAMFEDVLNTALFKYEEGKLEAKYPDFKSLMREYEEGTLLFAASEKMVWKKASEDTTGLRNYFDKKLKGRFKWDKRATVNVVTLRQGGEEEAKKVLEYFKNHTAAEVENKFNTDKKVIMVEEKSFEQGKNPIVDKMLWSRGEISDIQKDEKTKAYYIIKIMDILPPADKTLEESRGYAVAEYGDFLEKEWVAQLQKNIPLKVDTKVFDSLVKK